jgi:hypothetical protein
MTPPRGIYLTGPEVATIRRELLTVEHQVEAIHAGLPTAQVMRHLREAIDGVRFLLERAEQRRDVH